MGGREFRTVAQQIELLEHRGMRFSDKEVAKKHLEHISYYRLKGYWWDMQTDPHSHIFAQDASFDEVIRRYSFDKELRPILFNAIESIEIALRTTLVCQLSSEYGGLFYENNTLFSDAIQHSKIIEVLRGDFLRSNEIFAKDFKKKYGKSTDHKCVDLSRSPEAWIIFEVATFGTLSKLYKNLKHQLPAKSRIANTFGLNIHSDLSSWLEAISNLRNIVAHHSRVWNRVMVKRLTKVSKVRNTWLVKSMTESQEKKAFHVISAMLYLCNAIEDGEQFRAAILALFQRYPSVLREGLGFCNTWADEPLWSS